MKRLLLFVCLLPMLCIAQFKPPLPYPNTDIHDYDKVLTDVEKQKLDAKILSLRTNSSIEVAVVILSDLQGREIEDVATTLFRNWGIGKKELNNGVLYIISPANRKSRIETGLGLEADLPDMVTKDLQIPAREYYTRQDYFGGIDLVLTGIISYLNPIAKQQREALAAERKRQEAIATQKVIDFFKWLGLFVLIIGSTVGIILYRKYRRQKKEEELAELKRLQAEEETKEKNRKSILHSLKVLIADVTNYINKYTGLFERNFADYRKYGVNVEELTAMLHTACAKLRNYINENVLTDSMSYDQCSKYQYSFNSLLHNIKQCIHQADEIMQENIRKEKHVLEFMRTMHDLRDRAAKKNPNNLLDNVFNKFDRVRRNESYYPLYDDAILLYNHYDGIINRERYEKERIEKEQRDKRQKEEQRIRRIRQLEQEEEEENDRRRRNSYSSSSSSSYSSSYSSSSDSSSSDSSSGSYGGGSSSGGGSSDSW